MDTPNVRPFLKFSVFVSLSLSLLTMILAAPFDSGLRMWTQPNGVTFIARHWGDEFQWWMRTDDGYSIIKGSDGYFYYAVLDTFGNEI